MSDDDYEDGEILEEGEEVEVATVASSANGASAEPTAASAAPEPPKNDAKPTGNGADGPTSALPPPAPRSRPPSANAEPLLQAPPRRSSGYAGPSPGGYRAPSPSGYAASSSAPRKRMHSDMDGPTAYRNGGNDRGAPSRSSTPVPAHESEPRRRDDSEYSDGMILRFPRQVVASNVLLNFGRWAEAFTSRSRKRLDADDLRDMVLNVVDGKPCVSPFLMESLFPNKPAPTKVCLVLLGNLHPAVLQRHCPDLPFFKACTSVPCMLTNANQDKRRESPLPHLLYRFPKPPVNTKDLSGDQLFYEHELTFLMAHSQGWSDEVILQPSGVFARKSQPQGGTWELDGDLLHLKWRLQRNKADEADGLVGDDDEDDDSFSLDVLVSEDPSMHYFITETVTDKTYAHETPDHMKTKRQRTDGDQPRQIRMSLVKATVADVPRDANGAVIRSKKAASKSSGGEEPVKEAFDVASLTQDAFEEFVLSSDELVHHLFPVDVAAEQAALMKESKGASRDIFVKTQPRPESVKKPATPDVYALDCEMCETDIGMELTRITVVNALGEVVYDQLVKPQNTIINYHTQYSGITEEMLASTRCILADVQRDLLEKFLFEDTILVGHSLTSDLRALRIVHLKIADTAILYPHERGFPFRASLKMLMKTYLGKDIQTKLQDGHDSAEDARAAMELLIQKIRRGPTYGIPEAGLSSTAYDSLPDKLATRNKRVSMLKYEHKLSGDWVIEEKKAWDLYASGHHQLQIHNPLDHAKQLKATHTDNAGESVTDHPTIADASHTGFDPTALIESVKAASDRGDAMCWLEINQVSDQSSAKDFILNHSRWMERQETYCDEVDALLRRLRDEAISDGTLMMVVPQGDLGLLRYVKALSTRSRWNDVTPEKEIVNELKDAVTDAFRGAWDGCAFFTQK